MLTVDHLSKAILEMGYYPICDESDRIFVAFIYQMIPIICYYDETERLLSLTSIGDKVSEENLPSQLNHCNRVNSESDQARCYVDERGTLRLIYKSLLIRRQDLIIVLETGARQLARMKAALYRLRMRGVF